MNAAATGQTKGPAVSGFAGHTRISTTALSSVARAAAAEAFGVPPASVRVWWADDAGALALSVSSAISAPPLGSFRRNSQDLAPSGVGIVQRATDAKAQIQELVERLSGSQLSRVDVRISGILPTEQRRVQ